MLNLQALAKDHIFLATVINNIEFAVVSNVFVTLGGINVYHISSTGKFLFSILLSEN